MTYQDSNIEFLPKPTIHNFIDIEGHRFGRLTVLGIVGRALRQCIWLCECDCGAFTSVRSQELRNGTTKSCGCLSSDMTAERNMTHGLSHLPEYDVWCGMKKRCTNRNAKDFIHYGGRGIKVCDRWQDFANFFEDMGIRPTPKHTIERRDNDKDYEFDNCYWATQKKQNNNTRRNHQITFNGKTQTMAQWSEELHISYKNLSCRINRYKWSIQDALTIPDGKPGAKFVRPQYKNV